MVETTSKLETAVYLVPERFQKINFGQSSNYPQLVERLDHRGFDYTTNLIFGGFTREGIERMVNEGVVKFAHWPAKKPVIDDLYFTEKGRIILEKLAQRAASALTAMKAENRGLVASIETIAKEIKVDKWTAQAALTIGRESGIVKEETYQDIKVLYRAAY